MLRHVGDIAGERSSRAERPHLVQDVLGIRVQVEATEQEKPLLAARVDRVHLDEQALAPETPRAQDP